MTPVTASVGFTAPPPWLLVTLVGWGLVSGWVATWFAHRYRLASDESGYEYAELGVASCWSCGRTVELSDASPLAGLRCVGCSSPLGKTWAFGTLACVAGSVLMGFAIGTSWALAPFAWLVPVLVIAALVDLRTMLIPRRVVWGGFTVGAALIAAVSVASGHPERLLPAALGAGGYFLFLFILHLISPSSMGFGDVRLAVLLGLHLGWIDPILCFYALFLGCIVYLGYAVPHRIRLGREAGKFSPFGPALAASTIATVCLWSTLVKR